jgi:hypothetical protein
MRLDLGATRRLYSDLEADESTYGRVGGLDHSDSLVRSALQNSGLLDQLLEEADPARRARMIRGRYEPQWWTRMMEVAGIGAIPVAQGVEAFMRERELSKRKLHGGIAADDVLETFVKGATGGANALLGSSLLALGSLMGGPKDADKGLAADTLRRALNGVGSVLYATGRGLPDFTLQELQVVSNRLRGKYNRRHDFIGYLMQAPISPLMTFSPVPSEDLPTILPTPETFAVYEPIWDNRRIVESQDIRNWLNPSWRMSRHIDAGGIESLAVLPELAFLAPSYASYVGASLPRGQAAGLGIDIVGDITNLIPGKVFASALRVPGEASKAIAKTVGLAGDEGLARGLFEAILESTLRGGDEVEQLGSRWYKFLDKVRQADKSARTFSMRFLHLPLTSKDRIAFDAAMQAKEAAEVVRHNVTLELVDPGTGVLAEMDRTFQDSVVRHMVPGADKRDWMQVARAFDPDESIPQSLLWVNTRGKNGFLPAVGLAERIMRDSMQAVWDGMKTWMDEAVDPDLAKAIIDGDIPNHPLVENLAAEGERLWGRQLADIADTYGQSVANVVGDLQRTWTPYQEQLASHLISTDHMSLARRRAFSAYHSFRSYAWHWNPEAQLAVLEASNPIQAAIKREQMTKARSPVAGGGQPWEAREVLDDEALNVLGQLPFREQAFLEARAVGTLLFRNRLAEDIAKKAQRGLPFMGKNFEEMAQWVLEGVDPELLADSGKTAKQWLTDFMRDTLGSTPEARRQYIYDTFGADPHLTKQIFDRWYTAEWRSMMMPDSIMYPAISGMSVDPAAHGLLVEPKTPRDIPVFKQLANLMGKWRWGKAVLNIGGQVRNIEANLVHMWNVAGWQVTPKHVRQALRLMDRAGAADEPLRNIFDAFTTIDSYTWGMTERRMAGLSERFISAANIMGWGEEVKGLLDRMLGMWGRAWEFNEKLPRYTIGGRLYDDFLKRFRSAGEVTDLTDVHGVLTKEFLESRVAQRRRMLQQSAIDVSKIGDLEAAAATAAEFMGKKAIFDYQNVPPVIDWMRGLGFMPFVTFPYRAIPATFRAALEHPNRFAVWGKMVRTIENLDGQQDKYRAMEPEWMRNAGFMRVPMDGGSKFLNLTYLLPWGEVIDQTDFALQRHLGVKEGAEQIVINMPILNAIVEAFTGESTLTKKPYTDENDPARDRKALARLWMNVMPPVLGGSESQLDLQRRWTQDWLKYHKEGKVPTVVGRDLVDLPQGRALMQAFDEWNELVYRFPLMKQMMVPGQHAPTSTVAAFRMFGLRLTPFDEKKQVGSLQLGMTKELGRLKGRLKEIDEQVVQLERRPQLNYTLLRDLLNERRREIEQTARWYDNHPWVRYNREVVHAPSFGDAYWLEREHENTQRELAELEGSRE